VLHNRHVTSAVIGASRPDQISENTKAAEARLDEDIMASIDDVLGDIIERDPVKGWPTVRRHGALASTRDSLIRP
jgi:diketogulonate reductase-like aldo/keto reductase